MWVHVYIYVLHKCISIFFMHSSFVLDYNLFFWKTKHTDLLKLDQLQVKAALRRLLLVLQLYLMAMEARKPVRWLQQNFPIIFSYMLCSLHTSKCFQAMKRITSHIQSKGYTLMLKKKIWISVIF